MPSRKPTVWDGSSPSRSAKSMPLTPAGASSRSPTTSAQMSDAFNQPLSDVAEAQYQVLSNQFTTAADRANILTAANALSRSRRRASLMRSLLLTGALNAYGESSDMAGLRAAQFDKTIELGRLRMGELGTAMGRVQSIAHEVGHQHGGTASLPGCHYDRRREGHRSRHAIAQASSQGC